MNEINRLKNRLIEKYPNDEQIKKLTQLDIKRVLKKYFQNVNISLMQGYEVNITKYLILKRKYQRGSDTSLN